MILENENKMIIDYWFEEFITNSSFSTLTQARLDEVAERIYHYERIESMDPDEQPFIDCLNNHKYLVQRMVFEFISILSKEGMDVEIGFCMRHTDVEVWYIIPDDAEEIHDKLIDHEFMATEKYLSADCRFTATVFERRENMCFPDDFIVLGSNLKN